MKAFKEKIRDLFDDYEKLVLVRIYLLKVEMEFSHVINILF